MKRGRRRRQLKHKSYRFAGICFGVGAEITQAVEEWEISYKQKLMTNTFQEEVGYE